jgi:hypothetical protein
MNEKTEELIRSLVIDAFGGRNVQIPNYEQAHTLRNITEREVKEILYPYPRPVGEGDDRDYDLRSPTLIVRAAMRLCGKQEDGNLPPEPDVVEVFDRASDATPAQVAAAWEARWAADPDAKPLKEPYRRILHKGLTRRKILARRYGRWTLVHEAAFKGCLGRFAKLLKPADLTLRDKNGNTPLSVTDDLAEIPPAFWQPEWMALPVRNVLLTKYRFYVEENFDAFHPGVKALLLADLIAA